MRILSIQLSRDAKNVKYLTITFRESRFFGTNFKKVFFVRKTFANGHMYNQFSTRE